MIPGSPEFEKRPESYHQMRVPADHPDQSIPAHRRDGKVPKGHPHYETQEIVASLPDARALWKQKHRRKGKPKAKGKAKPTRKRKS